MLRTISRRFILPKSSAFSSYASIMARTATMTATAAADRPRRTTRSLKREASPSPIKTETPKAKRIKKEHKSPSLSKAQSLPQPVKTPKKETKQDKEALLSAKKLASYPLDPKSPYPDFSHPTASECRLAHSILADLHGDRKRPTKITAPTDSAGCGNSPSVLDALVRTILSQNTSDRNSSAAKKSMDKVYGGSDRWEDIVAGGQMKLQEAIKTGGLSVVKSKVMIQLLEQVHERHGSYSLNHLFDEPSDSACMHELLSYKGIGPKTASCVLLFCLQRHSFAVDTHVWRLTGMLGWIPKGANREQAHAHLDARIPDEEKYALHVLLIKHGKGCAECKAGGKGAGKCELRKAFGKLKKKGDVDEGDIKEEVKLAKQEVEDVKKEEEEDDDASIKDEDIKEEQD